MIFYCEVASKKGYFIVVISMPIAQIFLKKKNHSPILPFLPLIQKSEYCPCSDYVHFVLQ